MFRAETHNVQIPKRMFRYFGKSYFGSLSTRTGGPRRIYIVFNAIDVRFKNNGFRFLGHISFPWLIQRQCLTGLGVRIRFSFSVRAVSCVFRAWSFDIICATSRAFIEGHPLMRGTFGRRKPVFSPDLWGFGSRQTDDA